MTPDPLHAEIVTDDDGTYAVVWFCPPPDPHDRVIVTRSKWFGPNIRAIYAWSHVTPGGQS